MASLILLKTPDGSSTGEKIPLTNQPVLIGRSPEQCRVVLRLNGVSREHARIEFAQGKYQITDLKSRNGTHVNNKAIAADKPLVLKDGDGIKICDFLFCFRDESNRSARPLDLPGELKKFADIAEEEESSNTTVEATFHRVPNQQFLDSQPNEKLKAIIKISAALSKTLDVTSILTQIADELCEIFRQADRCFVIQLDEASGRLIPVVTKNRRPSEGGDRFSKTIVRNCLKSLESYLSEDATSDANMGLAQSIAEFRIRSVMCVPLVTPDNKALGVIQLDSQDRTKKFTQDDLKLLICVANQASIALDNANLHEELLKRVKLDEENKAATKVQLALLPQKLPILEGYEFYAHYLPARTVGGDYYDFIKLQDGRLNVLLGDVSGKGVPAALIVARVSGEAKVSMFMKPEIADAVTHLNELFFAANFEDRFLTLAATSIDPVRHQVTIVNAGHVSPMLYRQSTRKLEKPVPRDVDGFAIGWVPGNAYQSVCIDLQPGDTIILCTDGILDAEAANGKRFTEQGVIRAVLGEADDEAARLGLELTPQIIGQRIINAVKGHAAHHPQFDDIAIVCYGRLPEPITDSRAADSGKLLVP